MNFTKVFKTGVLGIFAFLSFQVNAQKTVIQQNELPQTAQTFIKKHFGNETTTTVIKEVEHLIKTEYDVYLSNGIEIEFDSDGNWKEVKNENNGALPTGFIPKSINKYVKQNFPNTHIVKIEKKRSGFEIEISNGIDIDFNSKGDFLRIDD